MRFTSVLLSALHKRGWNPIRLLVISAVLIPTASFLGGAFLEGGLANVPTHILFDAPATLALVGLALLVRDYYELAHRASEEGVSARAMLGDMVALVEEYAIIRLGTDGTVQSWNIGAERNTGYCTTEIIGERFSVFYTPEDRDAGLPARALSAAQQEPFWSEGWRVRKDGSRFWASVMLSPLKNAAGQSIGYTKVTRDMTERRDAAARLAQSQKMEALGQLTGGVAHDFNNLLTVILGSIEMAEVAAARGAANPKLSRYLTTMRTACVRGAQLTQQLLAFSRRQPLHPTVVDPGKVLADTVTMLKQTIRQNVTIRVDIRDRLKPIRIDSTQLTAALLNVAINAQDAMPNGGSIVITACNATQDGEHGLHGEFVCIHVTDTGIGISEDNLAKVLEPFFTTKDVGEGSGLGLSQAYGFCTQSGGTLAIESTVGVRTKVSLFLPVTEEHPVVAEATGARPLPTAVTTGHILVVEDDANVAEIACSMLEQAGYTVTLVNCARGALELVRDKGPFDLLFSDVIMPGGMSGADLAEMVHALYPSTRILLTSGYMDVSIETKSGRSWPLISKPYRVRDLLDRVNEEMSRAPQGQFA